MKIHVSPIEIFIIYEKRSVDAFHPVLSQHMENKFGIGKYNDEVTVKKILEEYYDWCSKAFQEIIADNNDLLFVNYLFAYHESSILLWKRLLDGEDLETKYGFSEDELSVNRRILKLALEQTSDINYSKLSEASYEVIRQFDKIIEDILYLGAELYDAAHYLSEMRMIPGHLIATIKKGTGFQITRQAQTEAVFEALYPKMKSDFEKGIMDKEGVEQFKTEIEKCFGINYDFAASQIIEIKKHHNPNNWQFQTIEPSMLVQNLVANGVLLANAENFYAGLTLTSTNKLSVKDAVYKVNSMERYLFRPILEITQNGTKRHLIGRQKWAESITVLATNNFQWNKAAEEWKQCQLPFFRNIKSFTDGNMSKSINVAGVGEIDFIWLDTKQRKIVIADCKYNRARYDMNSFSADHTNFKDTYEKKISGKTKWAAENKDLLHKHFQRVYSQLNINIEEYTIEELFIINTPTLYMYAGRVNTVCFFDLDEFMNNNYTHPDIAIHIKDGFRTKIQIKMYPYL